MPRKSKVAVKSAASDEDDDTPQEITVKDEKDDVKVAITVKVEEDDTSLPTVVTIPFLTDRVQSEEEIPTYVVEKSKSARAICKRCDEKIKGKILRIGVIIDGQWGLFTSWQHLECTVFHKSVVDASLLDGYAELQKEDQVLLCARVVQSALEEDEDQKPLDADSLVRRAWTETKEPSEHLLMPLLPYQKEGLGWMSSQEHSDVHGGILADEMGMGKTIQAIAMILDNRPDPRDKAQKAIWDLSDIRHDVDPKTSIRASTLIILPTIALRQWQMEISRFTTEGTLTVKIYHGSNRSTSIKDLKSVDIVLTSYAIMETEYRKATAGTKVTCRICNKKFYPDKLRMHRKYFCGAAAQLSAGQSKTQRKQKRMWVGASAGSAGEAAMKTFREKRGGVLKSTKKVKCAAGEEDEDEGGAVEEEEEEEDEIDKQKKMIKKMKEKSSSAKKSSVGKGGRGRKRKAGDSSEEEEEGEEDDEEEEEEEDEIDKQKKMIKKMKEQGNAKAMKGRRAPAGKKKVLLPSKIRRGSKRTESDDDDDDADFEPSDADSVEDNNNYDEEEDKFSKKASSKKGNGKGKGGGKGKGANSSSEGKASKDSKDKTKKRGKKTKEVP